MNVSRKGLSKKLRFEVFKRDSFTCQYCGAKAPDVLLQVDHIEPVSKGGTNDILNLVTSCQPCNAGKSDRELSDTSVLDKQRQQLEDLQERREQIEMMINWKRELMHLDDYATEQAAAFWADLVHPFHLTESGEKRLQRLLSAYGLDEVLEAMGIAVRQYVAHDADGKPTHESVDVAWQKIKGICRVRRAQEDKPYLRDIIYIRGILRNRLFYCDEHLALQILEDAVQLGADVDKLKSHATRVRNWSQWRDELEAFIEEQKQGTGHSDFLSR